MVLNEFTKKEKALIRMAANRLNEGKYDSDKGWEQVCKQLLEKEKKSGRILFFRYIVGVAVLLLSVFAVWLYSEQQSRQMAETQQIHPVVGKPELILASGKRVLLDSLTTSHIVKQPGAIAIFDSATHSLNYRKSNTVENEDLLAYNQLCVPKGGEYSLTLCDGTRVWMNAESSLRFPVKFAAGRREVFLEGEAYFEVTPDRHCPFYVCIGQRKVQVLGTGFNISAYRTDDYWNTTLVTGKVKIISGSDTTYLLPSEQYVENIRSGESEVRKVNVDEYISWRDGIIPFRGECLENIINKLGRWYDFQIFYANEEVRKMRFRGTINRYHSFETILKCLEQTTNIHFEIKGKTVIASKIYSK